MRKRVLLLSIAAVVNGCVSVPAESPPGAVKVEAAFPSPGTKWVTRTVDHTLAVETTTWTVLEEGTHKGKPVYRVTDGTGVWLYDKATRNLVAVRFAGEEVVVLSPHEGTFSWPLWVGKRWKASFAGYDRMRGSSRSPIESDWRVDGYLAITVGAGTFQAFRLQSLPGRNNAARREIWYAPEIGLIVKETTDIIKPTLADPLREGKSIEELIEYHPATSPVRAAALPTSLPKAFLKAPTNVPVHIVRNLTLVYATINRSRQALFIVDTGAQSTLITPSLMRRLGLSVPEDAPRRPIRGVGGLTSEVPFVSLPLIEVGAALVSDLEVGVYEVLPEALEIEGLLGGDFLHQFKMTLDKTAHEMRLEPLVTPRK